MPVFHYQAKDRQGMNLSGILEASVLDEAVSILRKKELILISIKEKKITYMHDKPVNLDDLAIFTRQLAAMVGAGITIVHALRIISEQTGNKMLATVALKMKDDVIAGASFSDTVAKHPRIFSPLYINMVKTGEVCGLLNEILIRLAIYLEKTSNLQRKIRSALAYPIVVVSVAIIITTVLLIKVVPTFETIFRTLGGQLPTPTRLLIAFSNLLRQFFLVAVGMVVSAVIAAKKYFDTPKGRYWLDRNVLRVPVFGDLIQKVAIAKFSRTFSILVKSAVPLLNALDIVGKTSGNKLIEEATETTMKDVRHGETLAYGLSKNGILPTMVTSMIGIGECTGQLSEMLSTIADLYDQQVDAAVSALASLIEPIVIVFLGTIIGGIVICLFMPVFTIIQLIH